MTEKDKPAGDAKVEGVVLLHGLGRTRLGMGYLARRLQQAGFETVSLGYRSRRLTMAQATADVERRVEPLAGRWEVIHLVGFSLGGVISAALFRGRTDLPFGRVVLIGAPMRGSALAAWSGRIAPVRALCGPVLAELAVPQGPRLRAGRIGAIGGIARMPGSAMIGREVGLRGLHDGKVTLRSAWAGAGHRAAVRVGHPMLPFSPEVADLTVHFLKHGVFPEGAERHG
ncbi:MAG TPA: hypothetical protein VLA52_11705 [Thermohalobaculum sp.]|nr:hypothetical protein [Thermohalobaculum sp.]